MTSIKPKTIKEVRFDGRPFEYRRPNDKYRWDNDVETGGWESSPHSYGWLNPLYKYSEGQVTDAARALRISNVNRESEVTQILDKIRNPYPAPTPAPAAESNNTQNNEATPATINNTYADEIAEIEETSAEIEETAAEIEATSAPSKPAAKDFITRFGGNTDTMAHSGMVGVRAAEAAGYSIAQIQQMGIEQGITFGSGAQTYFNQQRQKKFDDQLEAIKQQNAANLQQLTIDQNTRLDKIAADQQRRSDELAASQRIYQQNQARSGQLGALQIGGAAKTPRTGGTQGFKRRKLQINPVTANALEGILGAAKAATTTNTLNI